MSRDAASQALRATATPTFLSGWPLVATLSAIIVLLTSGIAARHQFDVEGVRLVIRVTARSSLALFSLAFTASALYRLWPNVWTRWQRNNRRYLGVSFAVSHAVHAIAIVRFAELDPLQFHDSVNLTTYIGGGVGFAFIVAMTATSFDRAAAWIGPRAWRVLHSTGVYVIWLLFAYVEMNAARYDDFYRPFAAWMAFILLIRLAGLPGRRPSVAR